MNKVGMVLEGGGLRGLYTAGVLDVLLANDINVDGIIGTSAGALFGVNYFSEQRGRVLRYNKEYCGNKNYMSMRSFFLTGNYVNKEFAYYRMSTEFDLFDNLTFIRAGKPFYAVATDVKTGEAEYFEITNPIAQLEELRASGAIPVVSRMVEIDNKKYLDGGIADSIPINKLMELGYKKRIVIETQPKNYKKAPFSKAKQRLIRLWYHRYPRLVEAILNRYARYNAVKNEIKQLEEQKEVFVIRPLKKLNIDIKNKDPEKYQEVYDMGTNDALRLLDDLKDYLGLKKKQVKKTTKMTTKKTTKKGDTKTTKKTTTKKKETKTKETKKATKKKVEK